MNIHFFFSSELYSKVEMAITGCLLSEVHIPFLSSKTMELSIQQPSCQQRWLG